jgi:serine/threonine protein kinase
MNYDDKTRQLQKRNQEYADTSQSRKEPGKLPFYVEAEPLDKGGMGSIYKAVANPESPNFPDFIAGVVSWREAIGEKPVDGTENGSRILEYADFKRSVNKNLYELQQKEQEIQDIIANNPRGSDALSGEKREVLREIHDQKSMRKGLIGDLRKAQHEYVVERKKMLKDTPVPELTDYLGRELGVALPSDMTFAIKTMPSGARKDEAYHNNLARLKEEARVLVTMADGNGKRPQNVVNIWAYGQNWYAMDFIADKVEPDEIMSRYSVGDKLNIIIEAAKGLSQVHKNDIIHRDIKPGNIAVTRDGKVTVIDFGLAKDQNREENLHLTRTGTVAGTLSYMSPEQARETKDVDERADIYSLGATLYHLMTGKAPFDEIKDRGAYDVLNAIVKGELVPPRKYSPNMPSELNEIILRMMAKHPGERLQTMDEVVDVLNRYRAIEEVDTLKTIDMNALQRALASNRFEIRKRQKLDSEEVYETQEQKQPYVTKPARMGTRKTRAVQPIRPTPFYRRPLVWAGLAAGGLLLGGGIMYSKMHKDPEQKLIDKIAGTSKGLEGKAVLHNFTIDNVEEVYKKDSLIGVWSRDCPNIQEWVDYLKKAAAEYPDVYFAQIPTNNQRGIVNELTVQKVFSKEILQVPTAVLVENGRETHRAGRNIEAIKLMLLDYERRKKEKQSPPTPQPKQDVF